jgi:hypothetical protein
MAAGSYFTSLSFANAVIGPGVGAGGTGLYWQLK